MKDAMLHHFILLEDSISKKNKMFRCFFETATQLDVLKTQNLVARQAWTRLVYRLTLLHLNPVPFRKKNLLRSNIVPFQFEFFSSSWKWTMTLNKA